MSERDLLIAVKDCFVLNGLLRSVKQCRNFVLSVE